MIVGKSKKHIIKRVWNMRGFKKKNFSGRYKNRFSFKENDQV